jgi:cytochrome b
MKMSALRPYRVWDAPTRLFHWINAISVVALVVVGYLILKGRELEISRAGSLRLKTIHTWVGYIFAINLMVRLLWAFFGNSYAKWSAFFPGGRGYPTAVVSYVRSFFSVHPQQFLGHSPLGRLSVTAMFVLLLILAISGLVLTGTDLFYPPIGHWIAHWVAATGVEPGTLVPNAPDLYDKEAFENMRAFRKPFILSHLYAFYALLVVAVLHVAGVVITEVREGGDIISATFTGTKILSGNPIDETQSSSS